MEQLIDHNSISFLINLYKSQITTGFLQGAELDEIRHYSVTDTSLCLEWYGNDQIVKVMLDATTPNATNILIANNLGNGVFKVSSYSPNSAFAHNIFLRKDEPVDEIFNPERAGYNLHQPQQSYADAALEVYNLLNSRIS